VVLGRATCGEDEGEVRGRVGDRVGSWARVVGGREDEGGVRLE